MAENIPKTVMIPSIRFYSGLPTYGMYNVRVFTRWGRDVLRTLNNELINLRNEAKRLDENTYVVPQTFLTSYIKEQAVTGLSSVYNAGNVAILPSTTQTISTLNITSTGGTIWIYYSYNTFITLGVSVIVKVLRDATLVYQKTVNENIQYAIRSFPIADTPAAATYTYTVTVTNESTTDTITISKRSLILEEIKK